MAAATMGKPTGFLEFGRELPRRRPVPVRLRDWREVYEPFPDEAARDQGARCMDCGIPFCHEGCPLGNLIPEWNDLVYRDDWSADASSGCTPPTTSPSSPGGCARPRARRPACSASTPTRSPSSGSSTRSPSGPGPRAGCVPAVRRDAAPASAVAVVGSGPSGLACAQQLARAGHTVVVYERAERPGGLLRYGIPEFKMEKAVLDRRLAQLRAEGVDLPLRHLGGRGPRGAGDDGRGSSRGARGSDGLRPRRDRGARPPTLLAEFDAVVLAGGATLPRDLAGARARAAPASTSPWST